MLYFLVRGFVPARDEEPSEWQPGFGDGKLTSFLFWGRVLDLRFLTQRPEVGAVLDELEEFWRHHRGAIVAASGDEEPWVAKTLQEHGRLSSC